MLRQFTFKTSSPSNLLCRWTRGRPDRWILIHLLRAQSQGKAAAAIFTLHASADETAQFLREEFGRRYGTYRSISETPGATSVEVSNYLLPAYRGMDPVEMATQLLGSDLHFYPILVHDGYIHFKVVAQRPPAGGRFAELQRRLTAATNPEDFQLTGVEDWDPVRELKAGEAPLSDRQREVLRVAVEFGYYDEPRRCRLEDIAKALGVSKAAIHKRLVAVESKVMKGYAGGRP